MSRGAAHFDRLYAADPDPWSYETSEYEREKYERTLAAIEPRNRLALEVGCSIGVFTAMLAPRCDHLEAIDFSARAADSTRERTAPMSWVRVTRMDATQELPPGPFDLILCSEVLYYWSREVVAAALARMVGELALGGRLVAVNWLGEAADAVLDATAVEAAIDATSGLVRTGSERTDGFALGVWERV